MTSGKPAFAKVLKQANIADAVILAPFALPFLAQHYLRFWDWANAMLGGTPFGAFGPTQLVFVNLAGAFAVLSVLLRSRHTGVRTARTVGLFKLTVAAIFALAIAGGAARIFAVPMIADLIVGALLLRTSRHARADHDTVISK